MPDAQGFAQRMARAFSSDAPPASDGPLKLGDFGMTARTIPIAVLAVGIGALSAGVALVLLRLIGLFTNIFFFQRWSTALSSPADATLGPAIIIVPVIGALVIGEARTFSGGHDWLAENGVEVTLLDDERCVQMMTDFIEARPELWLEDIGE